MRQRSRLIGDRCRPAAVWLRRGPVRRPGLLTSVGKVKADLGIAVAAGPAFEAPDQIAHSEAGLELPGQRLGLLGLDQALSLAARHQTANCRPELRRSVFVPIFRHAAPSLPSSSGRSLDENKFGTQADQGWYFHRPILAQYSFNEDQIRGI